MPAMTAAPHTPPTTPPMMAPRFLGLEFFECELVLSEAVEVGVGVAVVVMVEPPSVCMIVTTVLRAFGVVVPAAAPSEEDVEGDEEGVADEDAEDEPDEDEAEDEEEAEDDA